MSDKKFIVALTGDFNDAADRPKFREIGLSLLHAQPHIEVRTFPEHRNPIAAEQTAGIQGVIVLTPNVTAQTVAQPETLLVLARFGVGYDNVDVAACTAAHVLVTVTVGAVDRSVAEATLGWMIALGHNVLIKDRLVRTGQWDERPKHMGRELRGRTLGIIGFGGIARQLVELLRSFGMNTPIACDPHADPAKAAALGVKLVSLEELMRQADFVSLHCPLTDKTRNMIGARELAWMKHDAYLINTARGNIVNEDALYDVLKQRRIAGAAIDCFAQEPTPHPLRFAELDNVLLAPHAIAWTDEIFRDMGRACCQVMVDLSLGKRPPRGVLNPEVFDHPEFRAKWKRHQKHSS